jgi:CBS domain-containing protein
MTSPPALAPSWWTVEEFLSHLGADHVFTDLYVLVDLDGHPDGLLSVRALKRVPVDRRSTTRLRSVQHRTDPLVVSPDASLSDVAMPVEMHGGVAVVVEGGHPIATLTGTTIRAALDRVNLGVLGHDSPVAHASA